MGEVGEAQDRAESFLVAGPEEREGRRPTLKTSDGQGDLDRFKGSGSDRTEEWGTYSVAEELLHLFGFFQADRPFDHELVHRDLQKLE
jgi:hypothetical protein